MEIQNLTCIPLFASLPRSELEILSSCLHPLEVGPGTVLVCEGERGDRFYLIVEGEVEVVKALGSKGERVLTKLGPGDYIGEMSLLDRDGLRVASVRTICAVRLLEMTHADFDALLHRRPSIAHEIARSLSLRLRDSDNATIRDLKEKNRQLAEAYHDLEAAQAQIIEKEKMERELEVARVIQQSILPRSLPRLPGFDFGSRMVPAKAVGGDLFDFIHLDENHLGIAVGDVSGKGVPAGIFMAMTRSLMRAEAKRSKSPVEALQGVNQHMLEMNDAGMFVTILYGVLNWRTGLFHYVRAGHELPVLCQTNGEPIKSEIRQGQALGVFPNPVLIEQTVSLHRGVTLLIYTDGVTDAMSLEGELFGHSRLKKAVRERCSNSAQGICDDIMQLVMNHQRSLPQHDDVTLVAVRALD
jgi:serine phosphatase RsbU (regulator of sigma subunit)